MSGFAERYGPWAVVAGASEGLGAAFAVEIAARRIDVVLVARREAPLAALARRLPTRTKVVVADLATPAGLEALRAAAAGLEVGLVVANAAYSPIGPFLRTSAEQTSRAVALNVEAPLWLAHEFLPAMVARARGGLVIMSSLAGLQGSPPVSVYAATKAFGAILAEGLWAELRASGVDVVTCVAGAVSTPGLANAMERRAPGTQTPERVVAAALRQLGRGPRVVPGAMMRLSSALMSRLLPRRTAIRLIARASRDLAQSG